MIPRVQRDLMSRRDGAADKIGLLLRHLADPAEGARDVVIGEQGQQSLGAHRVVGGLMDPEGIGRAGIGFPIPAINVDTDAERRPVTGWPNRIA
jgi:hypothetical protein